MGGGGVPRGGPPNQTAYYVALISILFLLVLLCCYFCYFFISRVKELSQLETLSTTPTATQPRPSAYPVQPVIRDSATAMAALCKQLPAGGKGGTVFPTSTSPTARATDTGGGAPASSAAPAHVAPPPAPVTDPAPAPDGRDKLPAPAAANTIDVEAAR